MAWKLNVSGVIPAVRDQITDASAMAKVSMDEQGHLFTARNALYALVNDLEANGLAGEVEVHASGSQKKTGGDFAITVQWKRA